MPTLSSVSQSFAINTQADTLIKKTADPVKENAKIDKSAKEFESLLLSNWLGQAEESFAKLPGGDDDDADPGSQQYQGMAMQQLGTAMTASGGIGIARMISQHLHQDAATQTDAKSPAAGPSPAMPILLKPTVSVPLKPLASAVGIKLPQ